MNKVSFIIALLLFMGNSAFAHNWGNAPKVIWGVRGGVTFAPTDWSGSNIEICPTTGLSVSFRIADLPFYAETGLYYTDRKSVV